MEELINNQEQKSKIYLLDKNDTIEKAINKLSIRKALLVCDSEISVLYQKGVDKICANEHHQIIKYIFNATEENKSIESLMQIIDALAKNDFSRDDYIIAIGGGIICDVAALAASLYMRGMKLMLIPTTLLAMVDASIGGKTAINLAYGKNLLGSFYDADYILIKPTFLSTLNQRDLCSGIAEIIKYSILRGKHISLLLHQAIPTSDNRLDINYDKAYELIKECIKIKLDVVNNDKTDKAIRNTLNLGHTLGHAIEKASDFSIPHGYAVAIGISIIAGLCYHKGFLDKAEYDYIIDDIKHYQLPTKTDYSTNELLPYILKDKKINIAGITVILIKGIGKCEMKKYTKKDFIEFIGEINGCTY